MKNYLIMVLVYFDDDEDDKLKVQLLIQVDKYLFEVWIVLIIGLVIQDMVWEVCVCLFVLVQVFNDLIMVIVFLFGGYVELGDMIYDMIKFIFLEVCILGMGWVVSVGVLIYVFVFKEMWFCMLNICFLLY